MTLDKPVLRSHTPTGIVPAPFILLEGEEKAGKSWSMIELSASPRVGDCYYLDLGEGTAEEYGKVPGAKYEVLDHDGTYASVLEQVLAVKARAVEAHAKGEPPVCLFIDSWSDVWDGLKDWVGTRAKEKPSNQRKLAQDPAAELDVSRNLWNDAGNRYRRMLNACLTMPGIVIGTAKGKEVSDTDPATGQPYRDGRKTYKVDSEKNLAYAATVWMRMRRNQPPVIIGARSVYAGIRPDRDEAQPVLDAPDGKLLDWLVFDVLRYDPKVGGARDIRNLRGGDLTEDERADEAAEESKGAAPSGSSRSEADRFAANKKAIMDKIAAIAERRGFSLPQVAAKWAETQAETVAQTRDLAGLSRFADWLAAVEPSPFTPPDAATADAPAGTPEPGQPETEADLRRAVDEHAPRPDRIVEEARA